MKKICFTIFAIAVTFAGCQNKKTQDKTNKEIIDQTKKTTVQDEIIAIDILLNPDQKMLDKSKQYNDNMRKNYPEGFELDSSHLPHITIIQAYVKKSDITTINSKIKNILQNTNLKNKVLKTTGLYYIPYENKGLAGITIDKSELIDFHSNIVEMMKPFIFSKGTGKAFVPRPDGKEIMKATADYVTSFVPNSSEEKYNPHVTIGTAYETYIKALISKPFEKFSFNVKSVSIYQLGELGTAQIRLSTIEL